MDDNRPQYEQAYEDFQEGLKTKEIAKKYEVSESTVRSWKNRYWNKKVLQRKKKNVATESKKRCNARKKVGAPEGNKNAKGNIGGGAPEGNQNHVIHGAYRKQYERLISSEMLNCIVEDNYNDTLTHYLATLQGFKLHEAYLLQQINDLTQKYSKNGGIGINSIIKKKASSSDEDAGTEFRNQALHLLLQPLNSELSKVQKNIVKVLDSISRYEHEGKKINISASKLDIEQQKLIKDMDKQDQHKEDEDNEINIEIRVGDEEY